MILLKLYNRRKKEIIIKKKYNNKKKYIYNDFLIICSIFLISVISLNIYILIFIFTNYTNLNINRLE